MAKVLGIDLGTTNSCMSVIEAGEEVVLENTEGGRVTPSVVAVSSKNGERYVGQPAKRQAVTNPENTIFSIKRFMGRKFSDAEVQHDIKLVPFKVAAAANGDAHVAMGSKTYAPPEISAMILQKMKQDAEAKLGEKITVIDPDFDNVRWLGFEAEIIDNPFMDICRSQIDVSINGDCDKLVAETRGFHWMASYGNYLKEVGYALGKVGIDWLNLSA